MALDNDELFDVEFYLGANQDVAKGVAQGQLESAIQHFTDYGRFERRDPSLLFNTKLYLDTNPDVAAELASGRLDYALKHFMKHGQYDRRDPGAFFNTQFYLDTNPDVAQAVGEGKFESAIEHFTLYGMFEGRNASTLFNNQFYLDTNADVRDAVGSGRFRSAFDHFMEFGFNEGRIGVSRSKLAFTATEFRGIEDGTPLTAVTVTRTGDLDEVASATLTLTDGTATAPKDYDNTPVVLEFAPGETEKIVPIPIIDNNLPDGDKTVNLALSQPSGRTTIGEQKTATLSIIDDEKPGKLQFADAEFSVLELDIPTLAVTVVRTDGSFGEVSATLNLTNGTATAPDDYINTPIALNFADGEIEKTIAIPITDDALREGIETVNLTLGNPTGGATIGEQNTAVLKIVDNEASSVISSTPGSLLSSDTIDVFLAPNDELTLEITVTVPEGSTSGSSAVTSAAISQAVAKAESSPALLPLDVFLLQDLSGSFEDDIPIVQRLIPNLVSSLRDRQPDTTFGVGSFIDKPISPFGLSSDYVYRTELPLTTDTTELQSTIGNFVTFEGIGEDGPEAQLEGLLQTASRTGEIGFRDGARRVVVVATDAPFHQAGDGIEAGITAPNNLNAILDGDPPGTGEDYPNIADIRKALIDADILPVFAVTSDEIDTYQDLVDDSDGDGLGFGAVTELSSNSSNLVDAITQGLGAIGSEINIFAIKDDYDYIKEITPAKFSGVLAGEKRTFLVKLKNDGDGRNSTIDLRALGFGDTKINVITSLEGPFAGIPDSSNTPDYLKELEVRGEVTGGVREGMLIAGVDPDKRKVGFDEVNNPTNPQQTWVVIHGWNDNSGSFLNIAKAIKEKNSNDRVLLLDWREASNNEDPDEQFGTKKLRKGGNGDAATWISPVAEFAVKTLRDVYGIDAQKALENLNLIGHSLGSLVSSEIGRIYKEDNKKVQKNAKGEDIVVGGVRTITALDPPSETNLIPVGGYDLDGRQQGIDRPEKFRDVSEFSRAFVGKASIAGNQEFATWAHESYQMDFAGIRLSPTDAGKEHGWVVQTYQNIIQQDFKLGESSQQDGLLYRLFGLNNKPLNNIAKENQYFAFDKEELTLIGEKRTPIFDHEGILLVNPPENSEDLPQPVFLTFKNAQTSGKDDDIVIGTPRDNSEDRSIDGSNVGGFGTGSILYNGAGNDKFFGDGGKDKIVGDSGNDTLIGGSGEDTIEGGSGVFDSGDDILYGGFGKDELTGGSGKDTFVFALGEGSSDENGSDKITDFKVGEDKIAIILDDIIRQNPNFKLTFDQLEFKQLETGGFFGQFTQKNTALIANYNGKQEVIAYLDKVAKDSINNPSYFDLSFNSNIFQIG